MRLSYINKIKANITISSTKKTSNLLDGTYKSVYKGKSMNFDNLREYVINDDVKDIDWKASARSGSLLVKQFIAEKKHNILIVMDSGAKMNADTDKHENKKQLALMAAGTIGYIAIKNGDFVGLSYFNQNNIVYKPFKENLYKLEEYLCSYDSLSGDSDVCDLNSTLKYIYKNINKRMIIFVITDIAGLDKLDGKVIKEVSGVHDLLFININDNYMYGNDIYDVLNKGYVPSIISNDKTLYEEELNLRKEILNKNKKRLKRNKVSMVTISETKEINGKIIELLEEHRYASNN